jgi:hypothetical protein
MAVSAIVVQLIAKQQIGGLIGVKPQTQLDAN